MERAYAVRLLFLLEGEGAGGALNNSHTVDISNDLGNFFDKWIGDDNSTLPQDRPLYPTLLQQVANSNLLK